jgi:hypothetical protein
VGFAVTAWLRDEKGLRLALPASGLLVGRGAECHVIIDDPCVSRRHLLVVESEDGVRVVPFGRRPVLVNDGPHDASARLVSGDRIQVESVTFTLEIGDERTRRAWAVLVGDRRFTVQRSGLSIGGAPNDHVVVNEWPAHAAELSLEDGALFLVRNAPLEVDGLSGEGDRVQLDDGSTIASGAFSFTVVRAGDAHATVDSPGSPSRVDLELVPNGGVAHVWMPTERVVWLPQRRCDLVATLLKPPGNLRAGDLVDDAVLMARIWGQEPTSRAQLNTLIHRTRQSFTEAGLAGARILERAPGGGATRFRLTHDARVSVQG